MAPLEPESQFDGDVIFTGIIPRATNMWLLWSLKAICCICLVHGIYPRDCGRPENMDVALQRSHQLHYNLLDIECDIPIKTSGTLSGCVAVMRMRRCFCLAHRWCRFLNHRLQAMMPPASAGSLSFMTARRIRTGSAGSRKHFDGDVIFKLKNPRAIDRWLGWSLKSMTLGISE